MQEGAALRNLSRMLAGGIRQYKWCRKIWAFFVWDYRFCHLQSQLPDRCGKLTCNNAVSAKVLKSTSCFYCYPLAKDWSCNFEPDVALTCIGRN